MVILKIDGEEVMCARCWSRMDGFNLLYTIPNACADFCHVH